MGVIIFPPSEWGEVKGIMMDGCVRGTKLSTKVKAHAHILPRLVRNRAHEFFVGWICVHSPYVGVVKSSILQRPSQTMIHEYAHILTNHGHDDVFRNMLYEIGGLRGHTHMWKNLTLRTVQRKVVRCLECGLTYGR